MKTTLLFLLSLTLAAQTQTTVNGRKAYSGAVNAQTSTYQALVSDFNAPCGTIPVASGTFTITLVASGTQPVAGQCVDIINYGSGVVTIARSGQNINGGTASLTLAAGSASAPTSATVKSNGVDYIASLEATSTGNTGCSSSNIPNSGLVCLESHTASASNTLDFTTCLTNSSFDEFQFHFNNIAPTADAKVFGMVMGTGVGPTYDTGANYSWSALALNSAGVNNGSGANLIEFTTTTNNTANYSLVGVYTLSNPAAAIYKVINGSMTTRAGGNLVPWSGGGYYLNTTAVTAVRFWFGTLNTDTIASGTIRCYGVSH